MSRILLVILFGGLAYRVRLEVYQCRGNGAAHPGGRVETVVAPASRREVLGVARGMRDASVEPSSEAHRKKSRMRPQEDSEKIVTEACFCSKLAACLE